MTSVLGVVILSTIVDGENFYKNILKIDTSNHQWYFQPCTEKNSAPAH